MRSNVRKYTPPTPTLRALGLSLAAALIAMACLTALAKPKPNNATDYQQTNLVSDQPGVAMLQDTNLVNSWGLTFGSSTPFWVSDNGSGLATLYAVTYDANGDVHVAKEALEVTIPPAGEGTPTGTLFNDTTAFHTNRFIFASEDGTISGWRPALGTTAEVLVARSTAVYKGIALVATPNGPQLLVANFGEATLDAYDTNLTLVAQYVDSKAPVGYAPFNVRLLDGVVFVTFAKQDAARHDDVAGRGHGLIDVFNPLTGKFHRFVTGKDAGGKLKEINSPWGLAVSPASFGEHGDQLLVGNFGDGTIMAFEADGEFVGLLESQKNKAIVIDGLWALVFGDTGSDGRPGTLYFTAGPDGESHGLFGALDPVPEQKPGRGHGRDKH